MGLFLKGRSHFDSLEALLLVAALLAEDTQGGHRRGPTATLLSKGFLEAAWIFSSWGGTSRRQPDKGTAQQPEGAG